RRWEEERDRDSASDLEHDQVPELRDVQEQQHGNAGLCSSAEHVRDGHDEVPREAIGPDAAGEDEDDLRDPRRGQDEPEIGRGADAEHGEGECDRRHRAPCERDQLPAEEQPELTSAERAECVQLFGGQGDAASQPYQSSSSISALTRLRVRSPNGSRVYRIESVSASANSGSSRISTTRPKTVSCRYQDCASSTV